MNVTITAMADPTLNEVLAENARLRLELSQRSLAPSLPVKSPFLLRSVPVPRKGRMTQSQIEAAIDGIQSVIVSGVESAAYGDKRSEFRSLAELRQILDGLEEELDEALGKGGRIRQIRMTTKADKGL